MRRRDFGVALLVAAAGLAILTWLVPTAPLTGDGEHYVAYAQSHLQHGAASTYHARRVLAPLIVAALPVDPLVGFRLVTVASLLASSLLTWAAAVAMGLGGSAALATIVFFLGTWAVAPNLREYALVDPLAWAFVAAVWLATARRNWVLAAGLGAVGVLAKEVVVVAAVAAAAAAVCSPRHLAWVSFRRAVLVVAPPLAVLAALGVIIPGHGTDIAGYLTEWWTNGVGSLGPVRVVYLIFVSFGALWLLLPLGVSRLPDHLRRSALVYVGAAVVLPFVGSPERMEELIFPVIVAAAGLAWANRAPAVAFAFGISNLVFVARVGGEANVPTYLAWLGLLGASLVAVSSYLPLARALRLHRASP